LGDRASRIDRERERKKNRENGLEEGEREVA
jgi:hypothetical protein